MYSESMAPERRYGWSSLHAIRTPNWLYIRAPRDELYRLDGTDPLHTIDLSREETQRLAELQDRLREIESAMPPAPEDDTEQDRRPDADELAALQVLGYVEALPGSEHGSGRAVDPKDMVEVAEAFQVAQFAARMGRDETAIDLLEWAAAVDPDNYAVAIQLGRVLARNGRHRRALELFERAEIIRPGISWELMTEIAAAHEMLSEAVEADAARRLALQRARNEADVWIRFGRLRVRDGRHAEAAVAFAKALQLRPGDETLEELKRQAERMAADRGEVDDPSS